MEDPNRLPKKSQELLLQRPKGFGILTSTSKPWYLPLSCLSRHEGFAFTFFRHHTAAQLQGSLQSELWTRWALQISHDEPAVRFSQHMNMLENADCAVVFQVLHAIIAVGFMHQARSEQIRTAYSGFNAHPSQQSALKHYSKAVVELRSRMGTPNSNPGVDVVLLACLLFIGFEMLHHDIPVAMEHLRIGLRIICDRYQSRSMSQGDCNGAIVLKSTPEELIDELVPIFVRLDYVSSSTA